MVNLLIAILENSYNNIIQDATREWQIERSKMILTLLNNMFYKKGKTVDDFTTIYCLEPDKPVKGIENYKLVIESTSLTKKNNNT